MLHTIIHTMRTLGKHGMLLYSILLIKQKLAKVHSYHWAEMILSNSRPRLQHRKHSSNQLPQQMTWAVSTYSMMINLRNHYLNSHNNHKRPATGLIYSEMIYQLQTTNRQINNNTVDLLKIHLTYSETQDKHRDRSDIRIKTFISLQIISLNQCQTI